MARHILILFLLVLLLLLLLCGDIHPNPGPGNGPKRCPKFLCTVCGRGVRSNSKAVSCDNCGQWTQIKCCELSDDDYSALLSLSSDFSNLVMAACKLNCPTIKIPVSKKFWRI